MRGILLMATKHPYYGRMAYNLAVSIKSTGTEIPIAVLHSGRGLSHLSDRQKEIFDQVIEIKEEGFAAKVFLYKHSPFKQTLFLDVDTAWFQRKPDEIFDKMGEAYFEPIIEGYFDTVTQENKIHPKYNLWADLGAILKAYPIKGKLFQIRSEVLYFTKDKRTADIFSNAVKIQAAPKIEVNKFGGEVPDEFALLVSAGMKGWEPTLTNWFPSYWYNIKKKMLPLPVIAQDHYLLSAGSNQSGPAVKRIYNTVMAAAFKKLRLQYLFMLQSKRDSIPERNLI